MTIQRRIKDIEEHFDNLTMEEFEKNMYNAGAYKIKAAEESGFRLSLSGKIKKNKKSSFPPCPDS